MVLVPVPVPAASGPQFDLGCKERKEGKGKELRLHAAHSGLRQWERNANKRPKKSKKGYHRGHGAMD